MNPIRRLTRKDTPWNLSSEQDQAFANVQRLVPEVPVVCYYEPLQHLTMGVTQARVALEQRYLRTISRESTQVVISKILKPSTLK